MATRIVLVGAGHAHLGVLRDFGRRSPEGVALTVVAREALTPYSGMVPGLVAGHFRAEEVHVDTAALAALAGARLRLDEVVGLDPDRREVVCRNGPPEPYDLVSLDIGSTPSVAEVPGGAEHAIPVKPIDGLLGRFEAMRRRVLDAGGRASVAVVGAGPGGFEIALAAEHRLRADVAAAGGEPEALRFLLVSGAADILPGMPDGMRRRARRALLRRGVDVAVGHRVVRVAPGRLDLDDGRTIEADEVLWTTEAGAAPWLAQTGLALDARGFVRVDARLCAVGRPDVFAAGDVASFDPSPLRKSGVYAVRAGEVLAENLRAAAAGGRLRSFEPQREALYLVTTGGRSAIGTRNGLVVEGRWVWWWKRWIDRRFMARFPRPSPQRG